MGAVEMRGKRCGMLTPLSRSPGREGDQRAYWLCRCDCGRETVACGAELRNGHKQSCGCTRERRGFFANGNRPPEYDVWKAMRARCERPANKAYRHYGGRGIAVCEQWASFGSFMDDMGPRPSPDHQIERKDNDAGYSPGNCVWATRAEQMLNTRRFRRVVVDGVETTIRQYAEAQGIAYQTAASRLRRMGSPA